MRERDLEQSGVSTEHARAAARRSLGNLTAAREHAREAWRFTWFTELVADLRHAGRSLGNDPGFAIVAIATLALGIGANTSIFSIVHAVLLRQLPYKDAAHLVTPQNVAKEDFFGLGVAEFQYGAWRDQAGTFESIAAYTGTEFTITGEGGPERVKGQVATPGYLRVLGVAPAIGRELTEADAGRGRRAGTVALITHSFWMGRFGGDPAVLSRTMILDGKPYTIAGVLPRGFELPDNPAGAILLVFHEPPAQPGNGTYFYSVLGRLKGGITLQRSETDLTLINGRLESAYPKNFTGRRAGAQVHVTSLQDHLVGNVKPALLALAGAVALVLLIVCVNVSNLLLARASVRRREIAVRMALGASRGRVARQLLTEALLLAGLGAAAGLGIAFVGVKLLRAIAPAAVPHIQDVHVGGTVLAFNLAIAILSGILFGLAPLHGASRLDAESALRQTARVSNGRGHRRLENLLIVSETAFALILLTGAGLLFRTFAFLTAIAPGFNPENVVVARVGSVANAVEQIW